MGFGPLTLEPAQKRRKLVSGAPQNIKQMVDEAGHGAGMSAQHEHEAYDDDPADCSAHGYRSCNEGCIPLPAAIMAATTTARCSLRARFAVALETRLVQATYPQAPFVGIPGADRGHAGQGSARWSLVARRPPRFPSAASEVRFVTIWPPRARPACLRKVPQDHGALGAGLLPDGRLEDLAEGGPSIWSMKESVPQTGVAHSWRPIHSSERRA